MSKELVDTPCIRCGKVFKQMAWKANSRYRKKTCSDECCYNGRRGTLEHRYMSKIKKTATCWLWQGEITNEGYGRFWFKGRMQSAHRYMHEWKKGPIPADKVVMHSCDVRHCVNPDHLGLGTSQDNVEDKVRKGRAATCGGRLEENVREAIMALLKINATHRQIAEVVGVAPKTVRKYARQVTQRVGGKDG